MMQQIASPDRNICKKKQSEIKVVTQNFGKLILSWMSDHEQILLLLDSLFSLLSSYCAIQRSTAGNGASECCLRLFKRFPNIESRILSQLVAEIEATFVQIETFRYGTCSNDTYVSLVNAHFINISYETLFSLTLYSRKRMDEVIAGMQFTANDAMRIVINEVRLDSDKFAYHCLYFLYFRGIEFFMRALLVDQHLHCIYIN